MAPIFEYVAPAARTPDFNKPVEGEPWMRPPEGSVKRSTTGAAILAGNDRVLVAVTATDFDDGVDFDVTAILAPGVTTPDADLFVCSDFRPPARLPEDFLRFGVVDANGAVATNLPGRRWVAQFDAPPEAAVLTGRGGWSDGNLLGSSWWRWPHPPPGDLVLVGEWPAFGIPETRVTLRADGTWRDAARDDADVIAAWIARAERSPVVGRPWTPGYDPPEVIADAVRRARKAAGLSTAELARRLGVEEQQVVAIENAELTVDQLQAARIGHVLGGLHYVYPGFRLEE